MTSGKNILLVNLQEARLLTLIEGVLAANIFDWGSRACVDLYHKGTIIEIYRMSRNKMQRPWRVTKPELLGVGELRNLDCSLSAILLIRADSTVLFNDFFLMI